MKSVATSSVVIILLALGACDLKFTEPARDTPARLFVSITSSDSAAGIVRLTASLAPGFTEGGVPRRVENEALTVGGEELSPAQVDANGFRSYQKEWSTSSFISSPLLTVRAPRVAGVQTTPDVEFRLPLRLGPERLQVVRGAPIQLHLAGVGSPPPGLQRAWWQLTLSGPSGRMSDVHVRAEGLPPGTISIPAEWLPVGAGPELYARLLIGLTSESPSTGSYSTTLLLNAQIFWSIQRRSQIGAAASTSSSSRA